jgi:hypothetical protein
MDVAKETDLLDFFGPALYAYADGALTGFVEILARMRGSIGNASLAPYLCDEWLLGEQDYWRPQTLYPFEIVRQEAGIALGFGCSGINIYSGMAYDGRFAGLVNRTARLLVALGEEFTRAEQCNEAVQAGDFAGCVLARRTKSKMWCVVVPALAQTRAERVSLGLRAGKVARAWDLDSGRPLPVSGGCAVVEAPSHDFVVCRLEPAGL